jgi:hypothetical protein
MLSKMTNHPTSFKLIEFGVLGQFETCAREAACALLLRAKAGKERKEKLSQGTY